jgi:outer membrane protein
MKNASLILNGVLFVAVAVLYVLHFSSGNKTASSNTGGSVTPSELKVAYINQDTLLKYYDYVKVNAAALEEKAKGYRQQLETRQASLEREVQQYRAGAGNLTMNQARDLEAALQQKGQNLQMFEQTLSQQMMDEQGRIAQELYTKITDYLKEYSQAHGIAVVIKYDRESDLLYAGDSLDISKDVVKGLNEKWAVEKNKPAAKDSTAGKK